MILKIISVTQVEFVQKVGSSGKREALGNRAIVNIFSGLLMWINPKIIMLIINPSPQHITELIVSIDGAYFCGPLHDRIAS